ncbi:MAG: energy transducer TonB [Bacteroidota bacterium]
MKKWILFSSLLLSILYCADMQAQQVDTTVQYIPKAAPPPPPPPPPPPKEPQVFRYVEDMPRFPGCEGKGNKEEVKKCAEGELTKFIYKNLIYPPEAKANKIEGICVVQFTVDPAGEVSDIAIVRDIGYGCGEAAKQVVELMNTEGIEWVPSTSRRPVYVRLTLPVKFEFPEE